MNLMCERALAIGLPAVVFTEHFDFDLTWRTELEDLLPHQQHLLDPNGYLQPPPLDIAGYLDSIDRCRHPFADLTIPPETHEETDASQLRMPGGSRCRRMQSD